MKFEVTCLPTTDSNHTANKMIRHGMKGKENKAVYNLNLDLKG